MRVRRIAWGVLLLAGLAVGAAAPPAGPAPAPVPAPVPVQAMLDEALTDLAPPPVSPAGWTVISRDALIGSLCAPRDGPALRIALTSRPPSSWQRGACIDTTGTALTDRVVGRRVLLAFGGPPAPAPAPNRAGPTLTAALLYRALAARVPDPAADDLVANPVTRWRQLDPALPDAPIRLLLPPDGTPEARILAESVLLPGCLSVVGERLPRLLGGRLALCTALRGDDAAAGGVVARAGPGLSVAGWLRAAGASAVALVGLAAVVAEPVLERPLPLDGVTPSFSSITDGTYRAALPVHLLVLQAEVPAGAATVVRALTEESVIGPAGVLERRGLAALPAAERVRLRAE